MKKKSGKKKSKPGKAGLVLEPSAMSGPAPGERQSYLWAPDNYLRRMAPETHRMVILGGSVEPDPPPPPAGSPPPYDPKARCPKCGWHVVAERHCAPRQRCMAKCEDQGEHLHRICMQCQASWEESPLDRVARELLERCVAGEEKI